MKTLSNSFNKMCFVVLINVGFGLHLTFSGFNASCRVRNLHSLFYHSVVFYPVGSLGFSVWSVDNTTSVILNTSSNKVRLCGEPVGLDFANDLNVVGLLRSG